MFDILIASKDGRLAFPYPSDPVIPVSVVSVENGQEVNSVKDLRRLAHQRHQFILIPDNAMAITQAYNRDRTSRLLLELKNELEVGDRQTTLER